MPTAGDNARALLSLLFRRDDRDRRPYDRDRERERRDDRYPPRQDDRGGYNGRRDDRDRERERPDRRADERGGRDSRSGRREETDGRREAERERDTRPDSAAAGAEEELAQPSNGDGPAKKKEVRACSHGNCGFHRPQDPLILGPVSPLPAAFCLAALVAVACC